MKKFTRSLVSAVSLTSALIISTFPALANHRPDMTRFPNEGNLTYDGQYFAQGFFYWHNVGGWRSKVFPTDGRQYSAPTVPGIEFDVALTQTRYFDSCTSYNNLPQTNYDDCPTAGVSEPSGGKSFGIGTFEAKNIKNYVWYRGDWYFGGGFDSSSNVSFTWQETEANLCARFYDIWCRGGVPGEGNASSLLSGTFNFGQKFYQRYYW